MARIAKQLQGAPIFDAEKDAALIITDKDIKLANPMDPSSCAAALACKRVFKAAEARVHIGVTMIKRNGKWLRYRTPPSLVREIVAIDRGGKFEPGTFLMKAPTKSQKLGRKRKPTGPKMTKRKKKAPLIHVTANVRNRAQFT